MRIVYPLARLAAGAMHHVVRHARAWALAVLAGSLATAAVACSDTVAHPTAVAPKRGLGTRLHLSVARSAPQCQEEMFAPAPTGNSYGINTNVLHPLVYFDSIPDGSYRSISTLLREANVGWVRLDFSWGPIIAFDAYKRDTSQIDWSAMDADVDRAVCRGINVLGTLEYTPEWAVSRFHGPTFDRDPGPIEGTPSGPQYHVPEYIKGRLLPDSIVKWEEFVRAAVTRYPEIKYWSIWNEPNSPDYFRGNDWTDTVGSLANLVPAYDTLVAHAAPWIRNNPDGHGRRYLVAPELAGGNNSPQSDGFLRQVLQAQGQNIDIVAVHTYGNAADIINYMQYLHSSGPLSAWAGEVWLTEAGPTGCNGVKYEDRAPYCGGVHKGNIDDAYQAGHLSDLINGMRTPASASAHWTKTFYWHSHDEAILDAAGDSSVGDDRGILRGARVGNISGRPAYTAYASIAGPPAMGGGTYGSNENVPVIVSPAVPGPAYYYEWDYQWCANTGQAPDCDGQWYSYAAGTATTVSPYVDESDFWVHVRVRQYAWQGGPQIASGQWDIAGPGHAAASCGTQVVCDGGSGSGGFTTARRAKNDTSAASTANTAAIVPAHHAVSSAERRKGIGHAGNR